MMNFKFHVQSPVYFGRGVVRQYADLIASYGKKAMIVTTQFPEGCPNLALEDALAVCAEKALRLQFLTEQKRIRPLRTYWRSSAQRWPRRWISLWAWAEVPPWMPPSAPVC